MKKKVVFIGNSIVNGFPLSRGKSFPGLIRAALKDEKATHAALRDEKATHAALRDGKTTLAADVINKGENGQTTAEIASRFGHDVLDHHPAAVFIMTGTNDFIFGEATPDQAFSNLEDMAALAEDAGIVPVYMTPINVDARLAGKMWMAGLGIDYDRVNEQVREFSESIRRSGRLFVDTNIVYQRYATENTRVGADRNSPAGADGSSPFGVDECARVGADRNSPAGADGSSPFGADECARVSADRNSPAGAGTNGDLCAYHDGVHPTQAGYAFLAEQVLKWMEEHRDELRL